MPDGHNHAGIFGNGQELPRQQITLRMLPTNQSLDTGDCSSLKIYLRLVVEYQFVAIQRISQLAAPVLPKRRGKRLGKRLFLSSCGHGRGKKRGLLVIRAKMCFAALAVIRDGSQTSSAHSILWKV
jgi:hypothetical protein